MTDTVTIDGREWSLEGLPRHMVEDLPLTVELTVERPTKLEDVRNGDTVKVRGRERRVYVVNKHTVQLERDGVPLTRGDQRGWSAGEREGWRPWPVKADPVTSDIPGQIIDAEAIECD